MNELDTLDTQLLDELADGQWHPIDKIRKNIVGVIQSQSKSKQGAALKRAVKPKLPERKELLDRLDALVEEGTLRSGTGKSPSYRFKTDKLEGWRASSETLDRDNKLYQPRYFGKVLEDDGWEKAPLHVLDLIHFRPSGNLTKLDLLKFTGLPSSAIQIDEEGLHRIFTVDGEIVYRQLKAAQEDRPEWGITSLRLEKNLKRRDLAELPPGFMNDLCRYYGNFAKVLLRNKMSSVLKHIPDPDDIQQQIYIWIIEAVERYDAETSIPFGAYLGTSLDKWVFNLTRRSFGRSVADMELKHVRAVNAFRNENEREPTQEELATVLGTNIENVRKELNLISTVANLRNTSALYTPDDNELPVPSEEFVEDNLEAMVERTLLSTSIIKAASVLPHNGMHGLLGVYYENWGAGERNKRISAWLNAEVTKRSVGRVLGSARSIMQKSE